MSVNQLQCHILKHRRLQTPTDSLTYRSNQCILLSTFCIQIIVSKFFSLYPENEAGISFEGSVNASFNTTSTVLPVMWCLFTGESGLLLCVKPHNIDKFYLGTKEMNEKKIVKNVLQIGDEFFNFGDLVFLDDDYFVYFRDRIGDTFRWVW